MNIHQLSINYVQEHDRILVRINTVEGDELRLWFTRRLTLSLMPMLDKVVTDWVARQEVEKSPVAAADPSMKQMLHEFKRDESIQKSDFQTPYKAPASLPLGADPLLVTDISVTPLPTGQLQMAFNEKLPLDTGQPNPQPRGFRMALEQKLVHGFQHLLQKAVTASEWNGANAPASSSDPVLPGEGNAGGSGERPKYMN